MPSITRGMNYPKIKLNKYADHLFLHQRLSVIYICNMYMGPCHVMNYPMSI